MSHPALIDEAARVAIRADLESTLIVEAAAGTGKTTELVRRVLALLLAGRSLSRIVCVTFTEKAATEIKRRLIDSFASSDSLREQIERAWVSTIHGFCTRLREPVCQRLQIDCRIVVVLALEGRHVRFDTESGGNHEGAEVVPQAGRMRCDEVGEAGIGQIVGQWLLLPQVMQHRQRPGALLVRVDRDVVITTRFAGNRPKTALAVTHLPATICTSIFCASA